MLGNGRVEAQCFDGVKRLALIRGKLRKKVWINQGDIVLLSLRDFQDEKADVIQRYNPDEARQLKSYGELPDTAKINETDNNFGGEEDDEVEFDFDIDDVSCLRYIQVVVCGLTHAGCLVTDLNFLFFSLSLSFCLIHPLLANKHLSFDFNGKEPSSSPLFIRIFFTKKIKKIIHYCNHTDLCLMASA